MIKRPLGRTGLLVSPLGFGAGHIGSPGMTEDQVGTLVNRAVDRGVNFIDTARGYGLSEERIGRHLSWRRSDIILSTKVGYGVSGVADWSYDSIVRGAEEALDKMKTTYLDVVLLHSCPGSTLLKEEVLRALDDLRTRGLARFTGYSGENDDLETALTLPQIQVVETSVNLCDQGNLADPINPSGRFSRLGSRGLIAKRPLANGFWRWKERPVGNYAEEYWNRWEIMRASSKNPINPEDLEETAFRFTLTVSEIDTAIVGTGSLTNLEHNLETVEAGYLDKDLFRKIRELWDLHGRNWPGQV